MAAQSLGVGPTDASVPEGAGGEVDNHTRDPSAHAGDEKAEGDGATGSGATKEAASPPEHPLQKAITSFDMALGELNQLVHLVDLARTGEFMVLKRVTPTEEDQARAMPDQSVSILLLHLWKDTTLCSLWRESQRHAPPCFLTSPPSMPR